jgi:hypothetical protein
MSSVYGAVQFLLQQHLHYKQGEKIPTDSVKEAQDHLAAVAQEQTDAQAAAATAASETAAPKK